MLNLATDLVLVLTQGLLVVIVIAAIKRIGTGFFQDLWLLSVLA